MQIPTELQVYTKSSGHETLEGFVKQRLGSRKKMTISGVIAGGLTLFLASLA